MRFIAIHTFKSLLHEKILFNVFGITVLLLFFGYLASQLVYGHQDRVMLDMGLMLNAISIFMVAIGIGARFLRSEQESKTIYLYLSRPISRTTFLMGRFLGMSSFVLINFLILTMILCGSLIFVDGHVSLAFFQSVLLTGLESMILLAGGLMFSFWLRPAIVIMVMLALVFLGHNHDLINSLQSSVGILNYFTPNLSILLMSDRVFYEHELQLVEMMRAAAYGFFWILFFLLIGNAVFSRKNL